MKALPMTSRQAQGLWLWAGGLWLGLLMIIPLAGWLRVMMVLAVLLLVGRAWRRARHEARLRRGCLVLAENACLPPPGYRLPVVLVCSSTSTVCRAACSVQGKPQLCGRLQQLIRDAWLLASLDDHCTGLRSAHLLGALLQTPSLLACDAAWPLLSLGQTQLQQLSVLLDQHSEAHRDVLNLFYQVFDRGFMRDGEGRAIDFRNTVILMTSNLGSDQLQACLQQQPDAPDSLLHERLHPLLREHFQPALLARFQTLIYRPLPACALKRIVGLKLAKVAERLQRHYDLECHYDEPLSDALVSACLLPDAGARSIDSLLNQQILPVLSQQLLQRQAARQPSHRVTLGYSEELGVSLQFADGATEA